MSSGYALSGPFLGVTAGQAVHVRFDVLTPGTISQPLHWHDYALDTSTLRVEIGSGSAVGIGGTPVMSLIDAVPVLDGVRLVGADLTNGLEVDVELSDCSGAFLSSPKILENLGSWPGSTFCSWNIAIYGGATFLDIAPVSLSLARTGPGVPFCFADGSMGDHTTLCPCGNNGTTGNGCAHSANAGGANLEATGRVVDDDIVLHSQFEPASSFTLFLQHDAAGDAVFHDGVLCAGGSLVRLRGRAAVAGEAFFPNSNFANDSTTTLSQRGGVFVGQGARRYYAAWFRNASTTFCPPATANVTNGWQVDW